MSEHEAMSDGREELVTGATYRFVETPENLDMLHALEALHAGLLERRLSVKGAGDWEQMIRTVLLLIDQQQPLFERIEELGQRIKRAEADLAALREAAQAVVDNDDVIIVSTTESVWKRYRSGVDALRTVLASADSEADR